MLARELRKHLLSYTGEIINWFDILEDNLAVSTKILFEPAISLLRFTFVHLTCFEAVSFKNVLFRNIYPNTQDIYKDVHCSIVYISKNWKQGKCPSIGTA